MSVTRTGAVALLVLVGLIAAPQASAQRGFYVGGSMGWSKFDDGYVVGSLIDSGTVEGNDVGFKIFGGYQFNHYFGVELAYVDLGTLNYRGTSAGIPVTGGSADTWGINVSVVGILPLNPSFALFGKVGAFVWEANARDRLAGAPFFFEADGTDVSFGVGASYNISANVSLRAEWEMFKAVDNISLLSLGIAFRF